MKTVNLELTREQAYAVAKALDLYTRMGLGQVKEIGHLLRDGTIPFAAEIPADGVGGALDRAEAIDRLMGQVSDLLGFRSGASHGLGNPRVPMAALRAYEVEKVLQKALALDRNPNPPFRGVDYDGLGPRYTPDPAPKAWVQDGTA